MKILIRDANRSDIAFLSDKLREADQKECAAHGLNPYDALKLSYESSELCRVGCVDGKPIAIYGIGKDPRNHRRGSIWLLGTDNISIFKKSFLQQSKKELESLMTNYDYAEALMYKKNLVHEKWLKWLGFIVEGYNHTFKLVKYTKE